MREVLIDSETTGLELADGHRIVELACLELVNHLPTGRRLHVYLNPEREMSGAAVEVHGLTSDFLAGQKRFAEVADEVLEFLGDSPLVIHNAEFDLGFLNAELARIGRPPISLARAVDTLQIARQKFPGSPASLDALCRRFDIDLSARTKHGALLDSELLCEVYLELIGGRQAGFELIVAAPLVSTKAAIERPVRAARPHAASAAELEAHAALLAKLNNPIWLTA